MSNATATISCISAKNGSSEGVGESVAIQVSASAARRGEAEEGGAHPTLAWLTASWHYTHATFLRVRHVFPRWTYFPITFLT